MVCFLCHNFLAVTTNKEALLIRSEYRKKKKGKRERGGEGGRERGEREGGRRERRRVRQRQREIETLLTGFTRLIIVCFVTHIN